MARSNFRKYLGDGLLIVFSVLFALFINKLAEDRETNQRKKIALESIKKELQRNSKIVLGWKEDHAKISNRLQAIITGQNDSLKDALIKNDYLNLGMLTENKSLIESFLSNTSWESAKASGIVAEFDFETTQRLTAVYGLQQELGDETIRGILDLYFSRDSHKMEELELTLNQFMLRFYELVGQESLMEQLYNDAISAVE